MKTAAYLWQMAQDGQRHALPILSFPAVQTMQVSVRQLVESSELQAQAMHTIASLTPAIASVSLMDLSVEAQAFGCDVRFSDHEVPTITGRLIQTEEEANALVIPKVGAGRTGICVEAIRKAKERIHDRPVLAGCIGPYSLAGRLMDVTEIMYMCFDEPEAVHAVLEKACAFLIEYCRAFQAAGADGVVMAEPLAGLLSPEMNAEFSLPYVRRIIEAVQTEDFALVYHNCGSAVMNQLDDLFELNAAAYHFGNAVSMPDVLKRAPANVLCMGNIDPASLFASASPESMKSAVEKLLGECGSAPNFLISSGCDIPPHAKWENINAFFHAVEAYGEKSNED